MMLLDKCCFVVELKLGAFIVAYIRLLSCFGGSPVYFAAGYNDTIFSGLTYALAIAEVVFVVVLLIGLHKNNADLVNAYMIFEAIHIILIILCFVYMFIHFATLDSTRVGSISIVYILLKCYFLWVIYSYHQQNM